MTPPCALPSPLVELDHVERTYGVNMQVTALRDVTLEISRGEWLAVVGPSGSGKSTLLNILGLLDRPTSGRYFLNGIDVETLNDRGRARLRGSDIGFVFQSFHLLPYRSVIENVMLADLYGDGSRQDRRSRAEHALAAVQLAERMQFSPSRLSGGERQRVAIARAVYSDPQMLLCDEPTGNLDVASGDVILDIVAAMHNQGLTVVMITHDADVAARAQRRVGIIDGSMHRAS